MRCYEVFVLFHVQCGEGEKFVVIEKCVGKYKHPNPIKSPI